MQATEQLCLDFSTVAPVSFHHKSTGKRYEYLYRPDHPLAARNGFVPTHRIVLFEKIGPGSHPCHWCQTPVTWKTGSSQRNKKGSLVADHLDRNIYNNVPENLAPSCHPCNSWRHNPLKVLDDECFVVRPNDMLPGKFVRHRAEWRICEMCGDPFKHVLAAKRKDQGRYCSRPCAGRALCIERHGINDDEVFIVRPDGRRSRAEKRICIGCDAEFLFDLVQRNSRRTGEYCSPGCSNRHRNTGERHFNARFTTEQIREIRSLAGVISQHQIANQFGTTQPVISRIILRQSRKNG